jgi:IS30 family transposase
MFFHEVALIGVSPSTISRELKRNTGEREYRFKQASRKAEERRYLASSSVRKMTPNLISLIEQHLRDDQWSPEQISGRLSHSGIGISHETIYKHIWANKKAGGDLYTHLRCRAKKYNKRSSKNAGRGLIPNRTDISKRPEIVEEKQRFGDLEIDLIIGGQHKRAILSVVDRASKLTFLQLIPDKKAETVTQTLTSLLSPFKRYIHTITSDNGKEFAGHESVQKALNALFFFAQPYHSWERGLNEHTNGKVRQYFKKGESFATLTQSDVDIVQNKLNNRPRKALEFMTPNQVTQAMIGMNLNVALQT